MLQLDGITKRFGINTLALNGVSLNLGKGLHLLVGPNGAGKSTLLRIIATVMQPDAGTVSFNGQDIYADLRHFRLNLGYMPQTLGLYEHMTGMEFLRYMAGLKGLLPRPARERADYVAGLLGIWEHCSRTISRWSVGLRQRLGLAQALLNDPVVLVLDEPFYALDPEETERVGQLLAQLAGNKVIITSSHIVGKLEMSRLLLLVNGKIKFTGLPAVFLDKAEGHVWSVKTTKEEWLRLNHRYPGGAVLLEDNSCRWKIVCKDKPDIPRIKPASPAMEDAYIFWLKCCSLPDGEEKRC